MKRRVKCVLLILAGAVIASCNKNESVNPKSTSTSTSGNSGFHLDYASGQYATFQITSANGNLSAEIQNFSLDDGGTADAATYTGAAHQQWRCAAQSNGYITIMNDGSGKFMQSYLYAGAQRFIQVYANSSDSQLWQVVNVGPGYYKIVNKASGLALTNSGTGILSLTNYVNDKTQWWNFTIMPNQGYRDDAVVGFFHRTNHALHSVAFDQGNSIPLSDGRELWITEDAWDGGSLTANGDLKCNYFFSYRNSVMIQPATHTWDPNQTGNITISTSTDGRPLQVFNIQPGTDWTWPSQGIEIGNKVYVAAGEGKGLGATGGAFYELTEDPSSNVWAVKRDSVTNAYINAAGISFGNGFYKAGDGYTYSFGGKGAGFNGTHNFVGRFPSNDFFSWTFWNGSAWTSTPTAANAAIVSTSQQNTAFAYWHGKYIMMQMDLGFFCDPASHNIYLSTSSSPTGPFTKPVKVFTIEDMDGGHIVRYYTPAIHAEFDNGKNELLLTYSVNFSGCTVPSECVNGGLPSRLYQVKGVRVPASVIGL